MTGVRNSNQCQYFGLVAKVNKKETLTSVPLFLQHLPEWYKSYEELNFEEWWEMIVVRIDDKVLSRKDIVLKMANKDGGAHIDTKLPKEYKDAKELKLTLNIRGEQTEFEKNVFTPQLLKLDGN